MNTGAGKFKAQEDPSFADRTVLPVFIQPAICRPTYNVRASSHVFGCVTRMPEPGHFTGGAVVIVVGIIIVFLWGTEVD